MGYYSEVAMIVYGPPEKVAAFDLWVAMTGKDKYSDFIWEGTELFTKHVLNESCHVRQYTQESIKWYDDWQKFKQEIGYIAEEAGLCFEFVRCGEFADDIETTYLGEDVEYILNSHSSISGIFLGEQHANKS